MFVTKNLSSNLFILIKYANILSPMKITIEKKTRKEKKKKIAILYHAKNYQNFKLSSYLFINYFLLLNLYLFRSPLTR